MYHFHVLGLVVHAAVELHDVLREELGPQRGGHVVAFSGRRAWN